jgi:hypothetical protein
MWRPKTWSTCCTAWASTGIDLDKLIDAGAYISDFLGRKPNSRAATALLNKRGN